MINRANVAALIPAYFEARHIRDVAQRVRQQVDTVLVVDDGSTDATSAEAAAAGVEVIRHEVNQGKGAAIKTGLRALMDRPGIAYVLMLDGDGQHLPEEIPAFLAEANASGAEMVLGNRMADTEKMPLVRRLTNQFMSWSISMICGQPIPDTQCGFRMVKRDLAPALLLNSNHYDYETEMLIVAARRGSQIKAVPVSTIYGDEVSKIRPVRDTIRFIRLVLRARRKVAAV